MSAGRELAVFSYKVGWEPKGWNPDRPWMGVSTHVRRALFSLAQHAGALDELPAGALLPAETVQGFSFWAEDNYAQLGDLHPLSPNVRSTLQRLTLAYLERLLPNASGIRAVPDAPLNWTVEGKSVQFRPDDLLQPRLPAGLQKQLKQAGVTQRDRPRPGDHWLTLAPLQVRLWSMAWLSRLETAAHAGQTTLRVRFLRADPAAYLGLCDTLELLHATRDLYGLDWALPRIEVEQPESEQLALALRAYSARTSEQGDRTLLAAPQLTRIERANLVIGDEDDLDDGELHAHWDARAVYEAALGLQRRLDLNFLDYRVTHPERALLDFFFARFFPHAELRDEQYSAVRQVLMGDSMLVLLPTGYGKSVIYQLVGLVQPGVTLIVAPINALIKDQVSHLRRGGVTSAGFIIGSGARAAAEYGLLEEGRYRLFYCSPERFETRAFKEVVGRLINRHRISLVAVDEAHCVSEWGHDFRPAYMHVRSMRQRLERQTERPIPLLALTATASPIVRADLQRALGIRAEHVLQSVSSDRPELSFSVHQADGRRGRRDRVQTLDHVISQVAPQLFGEGALLARRADGSYVNGTIVFTPYADIRDPELYGSSTPVVQSRLTNHVMPGEPVGMYARAAPRRCAHCGSYDFYRNYGTHQCNACHRTFKKESILRDEDWDQQLFQTQEAFLDDQLPVLVATKGFGMGIDKQNVRLITHYVMSGSLEAYYQEAGRAGRSGEHAHVALVTVPPAPACARHIEELGTLAPNSDLPFPCLKRKPNGYLSMHCPHGLADLCDVAQQGFFIQQNFPSAEQDHQSLLEVYGALRRSPRFPVPKGLSERDMPRTLARLTTLSVLRTYVLTGKEYSAVTRPWDARTALDHLETELRGYDQLTGAPASTLEHLAELRARPDLQEQEYVREAGRLLIDTLYSTVRSMRLYGLRNLYQFASLPAGRCRRVHLRRSFEVTPLQEDYRCGFCDTCQPDLQFTQARAHTPVVLTREQLLGQQFERLLEHFDQEAVGALIEQSVQARVTASFLVRSDYLLEQRPNNLGLIFLNATLKAVEGQPAAAYQMAERAVKVMRRAGHGGQQIHDYVRGLSAWQPALADRLYTAVGGPLDDPAGRPLALEALRLHGPVLADRLQRAWQLQALGAQARALLDHTTSTSQESI